MTTAPVPDRLPHTAQVTTAPSPLFVPFALFGTAGPAADPEVDPSEYNNG